MNPSPTVEALTQGYEQSYSMKSTELRPTHTLTPSESSTVTCNSTANLVRKSKKSSEGWACWRRKRKTEDTKTMEEGLPTHGKEPAQHTSIWMGWKLIFFGSCQCCIAGLCYWANAFLTRAERASPSHSRNGAYAHRRCCIVL